MKQYQTLLKDVARQEDQQVAATFDHEAARAQFIMKLTSAPPRRRHLSIKLGIAAAAAVACVLIGIGVYFSEFSSSPGLAPQWVQVGNNDSRTLSFDDGTKVRFNENSTGRVARLAMHAGEVTLESGRVNLQVTHTQSTDWHVLAGPYRVAVTGTQFEVKWNSQSSELEVNVFKGSVMVTGPMLENGHAVIANRSLTANPNTSHVQLSSLVDESDTDLRAASTETSAERSDSTDVELATNALVEKDEKSDRTVKTRMNKISQAWIADAKAGNYAKVSKYIATYGIQRMLAGAKPSSYLLLGNAARQARDFGTAEKVYRQLRTDLPKSGHAATAALYLGRMAFDQQRRYSTAVKWFNIYLNEQKSGTLHRETLGRLMEAQHKSNMRAAAEQTAKRYLAQYPNGPHSIRAKELSGQ